MRGPPFRRRFHRACRGKDTRPRARAYGFPAPRRLPVLRAVGRRRGGRRALRGEDDPEELQPLHRRRREDQGDEVSRVWTSYSTGLPEPVWMIQPRMVRTRRSVIRPRPKHPIEYVERGIRGGVRHEVIDRPAGVGLPRKKRRARAQSRGSFTDSRARAAIFDSSGEFDRCRAPACQSPRATVKSGWSVSGSAVRCSGNTRLWTRSCLSGRGSGQR